MRIAIIGQQAFGKAVLEAFIARGDDVAAVFCAPEKPGAKPDPLKQAAVDMGLPLYQLPSLKGEDAAEALRALDVDLGVMAYVLQFAPQAFVNIPRHGMIQYHPSLLPKYRGPSSINWPIIKGDSVTGLTIFRPTDGLDEGPVLLQKTVEIGPDDTIGSVYFDYLFPLGVAAMLEAADLVVAGKAREVVQLEPAASYEGWCREPEAQINWRAHVDAVYNLVRGCNPAPGAWTMVDGRKVQIFDAAKHLTRRFDEVSGKPGDICGVGDNSIEITLQGGRLEVFKVRVDNGPKISAAEFVKAFELELGASLIARSAPATGAKKRKDLAPLTA